MAADTYDPILGLILQGVGNNNNTWGNTCNTSMISPVARAIAGINEITDTSGTVNLSAVTPPAGLRQDLHHIQLLTGALIDDLTVQVTDISKTWWFWNRTSGDFNVYVKVPDGAARSGSTPGGLVQIPQGRVVMIIADGDGTLIRGDDNEIGDIQISVKAALGPGELAANGASLLKSKFPDLYGKVGTGWGSVDSLHFTLPNFTTNNRFLRAAGGSIAVGTYQSSQNAAHTHLITGAPEVDSLTAESAGSHTHTASVTDPGHFHLFDRRDGGVNGGNIINGGVPIGNTVATSSSTTGISVTIQSGGAHTHNVTGTLTAGTLATASQGSTEARPEAAAVLFGIRY